MGACAVHLNSKLLEIRASGTLAREDILGVIDAWYPQLEATRILWDLRRADLNQLTDQDYFKIAATARERLPVRRSPKTAYVVADAPAFLKLWRYVDRAAAMRVGVEYSAFTDRKSAEAWLSQR